MPKDNTTLLAKAWFGLIWLFFQQQQVQPLQMLFSAMSSFHYSTDLLFFFFFGKQNFTLAMLFDLSVLTD